MTIDECKKKICWRSMATPFEIRRRDRTSGEWFETQMTERYCQGEDCMAFETFEKYYDKDGNLLGCVPVKEEDCRGELHGFCKALYVGDD